MYLPVLLALSLPLATVHAFHPHYPPFPWLVTTSVTVTVTLTETETVTETVTPASSSVVLSSTLASSSSSTSSSVSAYPTGAYTVISARSGSPIHLLPMNAAGEAFYLGGLPATYCPLTSDCPPDDVTAFIGLGSLDVEVPGGQLIFVAPDGHLGFTQAHSASYPEGAVLSPFIYTPGAAGSTTGSISTLAFNAAGFMACPTNATNTAAPWQVFAAIANASVPLGASSIASCLGFDALTAPYVESSGPAAWEYI